MKLSVVPCHIESINHRFGLGVGFRFDAMSHDTRQDWLQNYCLNQALPGLRWRSLMKVKLVLQDSELNKTDCKPTYQVAVAWRCAFLLIRIRRHQTIFFCDQRAHSFILQQESKFTGTHIYFATSQIDKRQKAQESFSKVQPSVNISG